MLIVELSLFRNFSGSNQLFTSPLFTNFLETYKTENYRFKCFL